jgi:multicomponent Na+:H+ antiporter subunit A
MNRTADVVTGVLQNGSLPVYLAVILSTVLIIPTTIWLVTWPGAPSIPAVHSPVEIVLGIVIITAAIAATRVERRLAAALLLGVVGYAVSGLYVSFRAPDLALTQILAETLTVALFAFVLAKLPRKFGADPQSLSRRVRLAVSGLVGSAVTLAAVLTTTVESQRSVATEYVERAAEAGGKNVVNVILTNFRALDTLGEITVLAIAAAGVSALVLTARTTGDAEERSA